MKEKLTKILDTVRDPESNLSIGDLGLIERFRYNEKLQEMYVFGNFMSHRPACKTCVGISMLIEVKIQKDLKLALEQEFPELSIIFA